MILLNGQLIDEDGASAPLVPFFRPAGPPGTSYIKPCGPFCWFWQANTSRGWVSGYAWTRRAADRVARRHLARDACR